MKNVDILAIETSCDETSCAVIRNGKEVLSNVVSSQIDVHKATGGVVPEIASRLHSEQITYVIDKAIKQSNVKLEDIDAIAFTEGPGLVGALLVGIEAAKTLAFCYDKPLIGVHHIAGHIYANEIENELRFPLLSLVISGGHTELIYMKSHLDFEVLFKTTDDAIGETFDKVARVLRLPYPGGPHVDRLASKTTKTIDFKYSFNEFDESFSFSGLKTAVINYVNTCKMKNQVVDDAAVCNSFQKLAINQVVRKTKIAIDKFNVKQLVVAGGVAANSYLRKELDKHLNVEIAIPSVKYCTDNAVMIGAVAFQQYLINDFSTFEVNANPNLKLKRQTNTFKSKATMKRIPIYYHGLKRLQKLGVDRVSSIELADYLSIHAPSIRRDFSTIGELGKQGYGYNVDYLVEVFKNELGIQDTKAALIGVGNLGTALINYDFYEEFGLRIVKAYDKSDLLVGKQINGVLVEKLEKSCVLFDECDIVIVCVDSSSAKEIVANLISCGVKGILNFTTERFTSTKNTAIHNVDLSSELLVLAYRVQKMMEE